MLTIELQVNQHSYGSLGSRNVRGRMRAGASARVLGFNLFIICDLGRNVLEIRRHYYCSGFFPRDFLEISDISV